MGGCGFAPCVMRVMEVDWDGRAMEVGLAVVRKRTRNFHE